jgi:hypothetical protein
MYKKEGIMSQQPDDPKKNKNLTGLAIPGASVIGLGIDFLLDTMPAGLLIGLGCGFLLMLVIRLKTGEW